MSIEDTVASRGISEVVHFTTSHGCLGSLYTKTLLSRQRLQEDEMVRYLFEPNAVFRKDRDYLDYISLSIEHINDTFFDTCANKWHRDDPIFWCILGFDPIVLTHPGVVFATTNNIYSLVRRGTGGEGLLRLFEEHVPQYNALRASRTAGMKESYPTCPQAEALYPGSLSTEHLQRIYVKSATDQSETIGFLKATFHREIDVVVAPEKFGRRPI